TVRNTCGRIGAVALLGLALALSGCAATPPAQKTKIGVLLPDDEAGPRWEQTDELALENEFKGNDFAYEPNIETASTPKEATDTATTMINEGAKVLVFAAPDREVETAITTTAKARGIPTVGYDLTDSPTLSTSNSAATTADYVITTDYHTVGEITGRGIVRGVRTKPDATVIQLTSGPTRDAATQITEGQRNILAPRYDRHLYRLIATEQVNPADTRAITTTLTRLLDTHGGRVDAVLTANDTVAQAAITVLRQRGLAGKTTVTGYGAHTETLKAILRGDQFSTGYTPPAAQATAAATLAKALADGDRARADQLTLPGQPRRLLLAPTTHTLTDLSKIFNDGIADSDDVCDPTLELRCNQLSIP
ncbi:MAG: substrate-binding domain-containing protein, partial [Actinomycetes bacterium]